MRQGLLRGSAYLWCSTWSRCYRNLTKLKILHLKACSACRTTRS